MTVNETTPKDPFTSIESKSEKIDKQQRNLLMVLKSILKLIHECE